MIQIDYRSNISVTDYNMLRKSVGWNEIEKTQAQIGINNSAYLVAAYYDNKSIGLTRVISDGGYGVFIVDVIVLPEFQGKGVGKAMMEMTMNSIKNSLKEGYCAYVNLMSAKGRESFYSKFGFEARPNENVGAGMTQWLHGK
jgi:predicted N-acetyltransferase YhbS